MDINEESNLSDLVKNLQARNQKLLERESELAENQEELQSQKEELTAAIEELVSKNKDLSVALSQLQQRNQELDQLLYRTSHDLKTPLSSLQGLLHLMKSETPSESQRQLMEYMDQKVSQMNGILKSLSMLAMASFEKIEYKQIELESMAIQVINDLSYLPNFADVKIEFDFNELKEVHSDELVLYNILKCLLSNSIQFRNPLKSGSAWVNFRQNENALIIEVIDDGEGISPEISDDIFKMFFRGSERSLGAGLGLYIVKSIVDRCKGEIRRNSKDGRTTFQIILPFFQTFS